MSVVFSATFILADTWIILAVFYGIFGFLQGAYISISCAMYMDVTNPQVGATQFSILTGLGNVGMMAGETVSGTLITVIGFTRTFLYSAWILGPSLLIIHFVKRKNKSKNKK
jgi:predicted MFS family arabinose efflux permease